MITTGINSKINLILKQPKKAPARYILAGVNLRENYKMSNEADMRFLLGEIRRVKDMIAVFEEDPEEYAEELRNYRQKLRGLLAELEARK